MRKLLIALVTLLIGAGASIAQEKASWTANPPNLYEQNKAYPASANVRLVYNSCSDKTPLDPAGGYTISVTGVGVTADSPSVGSCSLSTTLRITGAAQPGFQMLIVKKGAVDQGFALFDFMDATAGPVPAAPQVDVFWEVLTDHVCRDNFGNHMPGDLYCVETVIGNNSAHPLQLAGVGFLRKSPLCKVNTDEAKACTGDPKVGIATPNISYLTVRASAQAGQSTTLRNVVVNGTQAIGLLMASFTPYFRNDFNKGRWATGAAIVGTSLAQAINVVAPDQTIHEINNLDDQAFRDGKLIPNNTQVRLLVFVQKKSLAAPISEVVSEIKNANQVMCTEPVQLGFKQDSDHPPMCYPEWEDSLKNCVKKLDCDPLIVKLALGSMVIVGDKIEFIERVVVDSSVTSQEVGVPFATAPASLIVDQPTVLGGSSNPTATVALNGVAPVGGAVITLSSANTAVATVPSTVTIPAGAKTATFQVTSIPVATAQNPSITATYNGSSQNVVITVNPPVISGLTLNPTTVTHPTASTGTVTISGAAPSGGFVINLSSSATSVATVPSTITVPTGTTSVQFVVTTLAAAPAGTTVTITASASGSMAQNAVLNVN